MSSKEGAFIGSPEGARVARPSTFIPIASFPQALRFSALESHGGPALDLFVRATWSATTAAPQIFTGNSGFNGAAASFSPGATAHPCGIASAGWRTSFGTIAPLTSAAVTGFAVEVAALEAGPWYALGSDHASSTGNPWGLFLASASLTGSTPVGFSLWAFNEGRASETPINVVWLAEIASPHTPLTEPRYMTIVASPCVAAPDSIYSDWLQTWAWQLAFEVRRNNDAATEGGQTYRRRILTPFAVDALTIGRNPALYDPTFDAIGMGLGVRPPHLTGITVSGRVRIFLGAGPLVGT